MPRNADQWIESFQIFKKYGDNQGLAHADHDEVFAGPADTSVISAEDKQRLEELGWSESQYGEGYQAFV